jgi:hypothetical protein
VQSAKDQQRLARDWVEDSRASNASQEQIRRDQRDVEAAAAAVAEAEAELAKLRAKRKPN